MNYRVQNTKILTSGELISILCKSAALYSEYADTSLLFIFRGNKNEAYDYYEVYFGRNNFMHPAGIKSDTLSSMKPVKTEQLIEKTVIQEKTLIQCIQRWLLCSKCWI